MAVMLQRSGKPVVLCVNKIDTVGEPPADFYEFYGMGLGEPIALSALHGHGTGDMLDACFAHFPPEEEEGDQSGEIQSRRHRQNRIPEKARLSTVSSERKRVIVSDIAGTTRDAIDSSFENEHGKYVIIDTAGMRRKAKVDEDIEKYSVIRSLMAIERSDVCLIMIDASDGVTEQDTKIAGLAHQKGKACINRCQQVGSD